MSDPQVTPQSVRRSEARTLHGRSQPQPFATRFPERHENGSHPTAPAVASTAPVDVAAFVTRMTNRWQTTLQNTVRPELQQVWAKLCSTLNDKIEKYGTVAGRKWSAFPGEMGVAKTEGLKLYCSMLVGNNGDTSS